LIFSVIVGFLRVKTGLNLLGTETTVAWATPGQYTTENNFPCGEGGGGCGGEDSTNGPHLTRYYVDPSTDVEAVQRRLKEGGHWSV
jgi:hypothetical protein